METKFNFNSQICTTRLQSERLLALGLKKETADVVWLNHALTEDYDDWRSEPIYKDWEGWQKNGIPAWSLGRLWELYWSNKVVSDCLFGCGKYMNPYVRMIAMIEYDIEDGTFNKDYLDK